MAEKNRHRRSVVVEGTVSPVTGDECWTDGAVLIIPPDSDGERDYLVEADEVGRELAEHLYEFVRVQGTLHRGGFSRKIIRAKGFDVLRFGLEGDVAWDSELEELDWEDSLVQPRLKNDLFGQ